MESKELGNKIKSVLETIDPSAEVILFGSRARGDSKIDSDWDLLILLNIEVDEELKYQIWELLYDLELETDQVISSLVFSKKDWKIFILHHCIKILKKKEFFYE